MKPDPSGQGMQSEEERKAIAVLKAIFQQGGIGVLLTTPENKVMDFNQKYLELWGMTEKFLVESSPWTVIEYCRSRTINEQELRESFERVYQDPTLEQFVVIYLDNGLVLERQTCPIALDGQLFGTAWIYRDVSAREKAEAYLRDSEQRNKAIVTALPDQIFRVKSHGDILEWFEERRTPNADFHALFQEDLGGVVTHKLPEGIRAFLQTGLQQLSALGDMMQREHEVHFNGQHWHVDARLVKSGKNEFLLFLRDVTASKETERDLIQRNFELDSFVYRISHDLKAPLNAIMGLVGALRAESQDELVQQFLRMMDKSVGQIDGFIRGLHDFSVVSRDSSTAVWVNLDGEVRQMWEEVAQAHPETQVTFELNCDPATSVYVDPYQFRILLRALLLNALQFRSRIHAPWVRVHVQKTANEIFIWVDDNGEGIEPQFQDKVFELFFRASNHSVGSGLGLYIAKNAAKRLKGELRFCPEVHDHTRFEIRLPKGN